MRGLCLGFTNPVGTGGVRDVCLCLYCGGVDGVGESGWVALARVWEGDVMVVCVVSLHYLWIWPV